MKVLINEVKRFQKIAGLLSEDDDINLSDTPEFTKTPSPEEVLSSPTRVTVKEDSFLSKDRFEFVDIKGRCYMLPEVISYWEENNVVRLHKGLTVDKLLRMGVAEGFFTVDRNGKYFFDRSQWFSVNEWLDTLVEA